MTYVGAAIITASGLYILRRESSGSRVRHATGRCWRPRPDRPARRIARRRVAEGDFRKTVEMIGLAKHPTGL